MTEDEALKKLYSKDSELMPAALEEKLEAEQVQEEDKEGAGEAILPPVTTKPIPEFERWWLSVSRKPVTVDQCIDVFGYVPKKQNFTNDEQWTFLEHAEKFLKRPSRNKMAEAGRWVGRFAHMSGKSDAELVQNYYSRKYLDGVRDKYPLPPRPSAQSPEKNRRNGFYADGSVRRPKALKASTTPPIRVDQRPRIRRPTSKISQDDGEDASSSSQAVTNGSPRKRVSDTASPSPAPKRAKIQKSTSPSAEAAESARLKTSPRKRKLQHVNGGKHAVTPKKPKAGAGQGKPKNADEAILKIIKKRFVQVKESGTAGEAFMAHFLGSNFTLPALIPYSQRPIRKKGLENSRVPADVPAQRLKMPEETFILAQQCLILTFYILQEHRQRLDPRNKRHFNTSQWQHCTFGDASLLHDIGDEMAAQGMFTRSWCPALYERAESDLAALARWEDDNAPESGYWPDLDFCSPGMVWRPELVGVLRGSALAESGKNTSEEGEDVEDDCWTNCSDEDMALLAALPPVAPDIVLRSGVPGSAASSVHQGILRTAQNHLAMSSNEAGFENVLLAFAVKKLETREDEEDADMRMLAVVRKMIEAGDVGMQFDTQQAGDLNVQEDASGELKAAPETSQGTSSSPQRLRLTDKVSQWRTYSETPKGGTRSPSDTSYLDCSDSDSEGEDLFPEPADEELRSVPVFDDGSAALIARLCHLKFSPTDIMEGCGGHMWSRRWRELEWWFSAELLETGEMLSGLSLADKEETPAA